MGKKGTSGHQLGAAHATLLSSHASLANAHKIRPCSPLSVGQNRVYVRFKQSVRHMGNAQVASRCILRSLGRMHHDSIHSHTYHWQTCTDGVMQNFFCAVQR